jgi:hypothetical protein
MQMNRSRWTLVAVLSFALAQTACASGGAGGSGLGAAQEPGPGGLTKAPAGSKASTEARTEATLYWYDGEQRRALALDDTRVADFRKTGGAANVDGGTSSGSGPVGKGIDARTPLRPKSAVEKGPDGGLPEGVSPVLHEASAPRSQVQALPGGVVVTLKERPAGANAAEREARARKELAAAQLEPVRAIDPFLRTWLVASPPGLESLELANRLHESGAFESASPNWWRPRTLK